VLDLQRRIVAHLAANPGETFGAEALALALGRAEAAETVFKICTRLAANRRGVAIGSGSGLTARFKAA